jgi:predicted transcriptional regulator
MHGIWLACCNFWFFSNFQFSKLFAFQLKHNSWKKDERGVLETIKQFSIKKLKKLFVPKNIMRKGISNELREEIRKLQREGWSDIQIAKRFNLPYSTVHYQRDEVRQRVLECQRKYHERPEIREYRRQYRRRYMREYYKRPEVKERVREYQQEYNWRKNYQESFTEMMADFNEFINLTSNSPHTLFAGILKALERDESGLKYSEILEALERSEYRRKLWNRKIIQLALKKLRKINLISYNSKNKKYALTDRGREYIRKLYEI